MLKIKETYVNETKGYQWGDSGWYEPYTENIGRLFLNMQREFGRCIGRMYRDYENGKTVAVGWVFQKRMRYEDARYNRPEDYYLREVWVEVREEKE